jgi:hypothetical protein
MTARAGLIVVFSAGEVEEADQYGEASVFGYDALIAADLEVIARLGLRFGGSYSRLKLDFDGSGALAAADGGKDRLIGGHLGAFYAF